MNFISIVVALVWEVSCWCKGLASLFNHLLGSLLSLIGLFNFHCLLNGWWLMNMSMLHEGLLLILLIVVDSWWYILNWLLGFSIEAGMSFNMSIS